MAGRQFPLEILIGALDRATVPLKQINNEIDALRQPVARLQKSFSALSKEAGLFRLQRSLKEVGRAGSAVFSSLQRMGKIIIGLGLLQGAVGFFFQRFIKGAADAAEKLAELSDQTGASVESLQTLGFAAQQVGVTSEQFTTSFSRFTKTIGELKAGTGPLFSFFRRIDPAFLRTLQMTGKTEDAFRLFIGRLRTIKNESARVALATAAFGRGAGNMANLAKLSASELKTLEDRMRAIGVISDSDARNADSFNDAWHEVTLTLNNLRIMIAAKFFPVLKDLATQFTDWLIKNKPQVEAFANQLARELPGAIVKLRDSFIALKPFVGAFLDTIKFLSENTLLLKLALVGLGAYIVGPFLVSVALLVKSLAGLSLTLLSTPLGWFLVGLAGIAAAIYQIVDNFKMLKATFLEVTGLGKFFGANANPSGNRIVQKANVPDSPKTITKDSNVTVTFQNTPPGTRVQNDRNSTPVDLDIGYQFGDMMGALP